MIYSPLEQFNILSVYDFSVVNLSNFEIILTQILILVWYIFYKMPFLILNTIYLSIYTIFQSLWLGSALNVIVQSCQSLILYLGDNIAGTSLSTFIYNIFTKLYSVPFVMQAFQLAGAPEMFYSAVYYIWSFILNMFASDWNITQGGFKIFSATISEKSALLQGNLFLLSASTGAFLTNIYFLTQDIIIGVTSLVYNWTIGILFNLTNKDFSYVIFSLNTSTIWLLFGFLIIIFLFSAIIKRFTVFPKNNWQTVMESFYGIVLGIVNENAGPKGLKHFPLIFTTFIIILTCNVLGMIPYSFTVTSHAIITFSTALAIFIGINIIGILKNRYHFLSLFFPPGAPLALAPLLVFIELVSYVFRVLSLSIRLFANLMSGHTLLKILSTFAWASVSFWGLFLIPIGIIFLITGLEVAIAFLQAYIFSVLLCIYINDAFNLH